MCAAEVIGMQFSISLVLELIGTVAFAASGAMVGIRKKMDILGISVLALCVAVGGGVIRDILLGSTPPKTFQHPIYALCAVSVAIVLFIPGVRRFFSRHNLMYEFNMLWMDSLGLGIFTAMGVQRCYQVVPEAGGFLAVFVGVMTGVGGGVLRDVLAGDMPYIFVKHFYASASIIGAVVTVLMWGHFSESLCLIVGAACVIVLRFLAAKFHWSLPKAEDSL